MFNKIWIIIKEEAYRLVVDHHCFILLMFYVGIGYSVIKGNFVQYVPGLNELLRGFVENGEDSLWGVILLINSGAGLLGVFLMLFWSMLAILKKSERYALSMRSMMNFCLRYYFYSAWLYLLTILGLIGMKDFNGYYISPIIMVSCIFSVLISIFFCLIYLFFSYGIKYDDLGIF